ncbi:prohibitin family protein [Lewinella sp. W8]|uniref:prohibitin family protein n=1 Tax=Lewinella sp. W8 TaxID=2528208 RepID=UPI001067A29F|nr:prohibitin family protein [Lewinella sp. W8]MTB52335.1 prohibitin family protein [Lewinella sp. W8]
MKNLLKFSLFLLAITLALPSCTIVREGQVGVKQTLGKYREKPYDQGVVFYNPFITNIQKLSTQTENMEVELNLPSKEGLNIRAEISILYSVDGTQAPELLRQIGNNYERSVILPVFRSAVADVSARYFAKDMHTGQRAIIEGAIQDQMDKNLEGRGIDIENVLVKSIKLPANLARAIEEKLEAEQQALRMEFVLQQAQREAEQQRIRAEGTRDAQLIIAEGLTEEILRFKSIEAFLELAKSPNTKVIVSDGDLPVMMNESVGSPAPATRSSLTRQRKD